MAFLLLSVHKLLYRLYENFSIESFYSFLFHCVFLLFTVIQRITPISKAKPPIVNQTQCATTNLIAEIHYPK